MKNLIYLISLLLMAGTSKAAWVDSKDAMTGNVLSLKKDIRIPESVRNLMLTKKEIEVTNERNIPLKFTIRCIVARTENESDKEKSTCSGYKLTEVKSGKNHLINELSRNYGYSTPGRILYQQVRFEINQKKQTCNYNLLFECYLSADSEDYKGVDLDNLKAIYYKEIDSIFSFKTDDRVAPEWP